MCNFPSLRLGSYGRVLPARVILSGSAGLSLGLCSRWAFRGRSGIWSPFQGLGDLVPRTQGDALGWGWWAPLVRRASEHAEIDEYALHRGSANVQSSTESTIFHGMLKTERTLDSTTPAAVEKLRLPGGSLFILPVHSQHRGRVFLPFADDDPKCAEVMSKVLMLARDSEIRDPGILEQLRG